MECTTIYFDAPGPGNTDRVLELSRDKAKAAGIDTLVMATTRGYTGLRALELCPGMNIIGIGSYRSRSNPRTMKEFQAKAGKLIYAYEDVDYDYPKEVQDAYRTLAGEGGKVAPEVVVAAVRAKLIEPGDRVIGIGGTFPGADTAFLIVAASDFGRLKVQEIICAPYQR